MAIKHGENVKFNPVFKDMDWPKGQTKLVGEKQAVGEEGSGLRKVLTHPNDADVKMQRLLDQNGK